MGRKSSQYRGVTLFRPTGHWRAQISTGGKTTSLGDHDIEEQAARAFDRASINKSGTAAKTNFPIAEYAAELEQLTTMEQAELVQMLRSRARKTGVQTSNYRGVSLLKQTQKWHSQINIAGRQVHLGFFNSEEAAAAAYDRAAINKGFTDGSKWITNFAISEYAPELATLCSIRQADLIAALASDQLRRQTMEMLAEGALGRAEAIFDNFRITIPDTSYEYLYATAERAVPKLTHRTRWALPPGSAGPSLAHATDGTAFASQQQSDASAALPPQRMGGEAAELRHPFAWQLEPSAAMATTSLGREGPEDRQPLSSRSGNLAAEAPRQGKRQRRKPPRFSEGLDLRDLDAATLSPENPGNTDSAPRRRSQRQRPVQRRGPLRRQNSRLRQQGELWGAACGRSELRSVASRGSAPLRLLAGTPSRRRPLLQRVAGHPLRLPPRVLWSADPLLARCIHPPLAMVNRRNVPDVPEVVQVAEACSWWPEPEWESRRVSVKAEEGDVVACYSVWHMPQASQHGLATPTRNGSGFSPHLIVASPDSVSGRACASPGVAQPSPNRRKHRPPSRADC